MVDINALTRANAERWSKAKLTREAEFTRPARVAVANKGRYLAIARAAGMPDIAWVISLDGISSSCLSALSFAFFVPGFRRSSVLCLGHDDHRNKARARVELSIPSISKRDRATAPRGLWKTPPRRNQSVFGYTEIVLASSGKTVVHRVLALTERGPA